MTRTKSWLLIGTILPGLTLAQGGYAQEQAQGPTRIAQAPAPADSEPDGRQRRPRGPGDERPDRGPGGGGERPRPERSAPGTAPGAPPAVQRPSAPTAPGTAAPVAPVPPRPPAAVEPRREPSMPRPVPPIATPDSAPAQRPAPAPGQPPALRTAPGQAAPGAAPDQRRVAPPTPAPVPPAAAPQPSAPRTAPAPQSVQPNPAPGRPMPAQPNLAPQQPRPQVAPAPVPVPPPAAGVDERRPGIPPAARPAPAPGQPSAIPPAPAQRAPGADPAMPQPVPPIATPDGLRSGVAPVPRTEPAPGQPPLPPADRQGRRGGIGLGGAAAIGLGAGVIGGIMATQGADRIDDVRSRREERREGDVTIIREPGRTIIRDNDRAIIQRDETERFRELGWQGRSERRGDENVTVFERPDGSRITTVTDEDGRLIRRTRRMRGGEEVVIIDNTRRGGGGGRFSEEVVVLPPPPLPMPRERYIVDADRADEELIYETITAPPIAAIPRRYTLDEVRYSPDLRARMRSVDVDTVTFDSGSWEVAQGQAQRLAVLAESIKRAVQRSPNEVFLVEGHTDAVGPDIDNLSLSDRRAQSVAEILTRDFQVPPENLTTQGYGEQYLKVATQDASRENRRVTLRRITPLIAGQN